MPIQTITLSSANVPGVSSPAVLNWRGTKNTTVSIFVSTTATFTGAAVLQYTLDDLMLVGGASAAYWQGFCSSAQGAPATVFNLATAGADGVLFTFQTPLAAVRINSTALSSGPVTMKVLQGEGG